MHHVPTSEEKDRIKIGEFSAPKNQDSSLARRVGDNRSVNRNQRPMNNQASNKENAGSALLDFSDAFTSGNGFPSARKPLQNRMRSKPVLSSSRAQNTGSRPGLGRSNTSRPAGLSRPGTMNRPGTTSRTSNRPAKGTPMVRTTRAMQLREQSNKEKNREMLGGGRNRPLEPIRESNFESSFGKPSARQTMAHSTRKPWGQPPNRGGLRDDSRMETNENRPVHGYSIRSPVQAFRNDNNVFNQNNGPRFGEDRKFGNDRRFGDDRRPQGQGQFGGSKFRDDRRLGHDSRLDTYRKNSPMHNSVRRYTSDMNSRRPCGRVSDVSMRSATPLKPMDDYHNQRGCNGGANERYNPFKQNNFEPQNPF